MNDSRYNMHPVTIKVASSESSQGRVEHFKYSMRLMRRLHEVGQKKMHLHDLKIGGESVHPRQLGAMNLYLKSGFGLRYFRRKNFLWQDAYAWQNLCTIVGIQLLDVQQSTNKIPAFVRYTGDAGEDRRRSLHRSEQRCQ